VTILSACQKYQPYFKLLDDFKKFECVYQSHFPQRSARELLAHAEGSLREAVQAKTQVPEILFETNRIGLTAPSYTSGENQDTTVERLFDEVVVMSLIDEKKRKEFGSIDTPRARKLVNIELKKNRPNGLRKDRSPGRSRAAA
jgi:hypothetical protein